MNRRRAKIIFSLTPILGIGLAIGLAKDLDDFCVLLLFPQMLGAAGVVWLAPEPKKATRIAVWVPALFCLWLATELVHQIAHKVFLALLSLALLVASEWRIRRKDGSSAN